MMAGVRARQCRLLKLDQVALRRFHDVPYPCSFKFFMHKGAIWLLICALVALADFLDPLHHEAATGRPSINLDGWMLSREQALEAFQRHAADADIAIIEGVMGLYDGRDGSTEDGSTAQMAKWLDVPVLLVVDCYSMARSAAAMVKGYRVGFLQALYRSAMCE